MKRRNVFIGAGFIALLAALGVSQSVLERKALAQSGSGISAPRFEVSSLTASAASRSFTLTVWVAPKARAACNCCPADRRR